MARGRGVAPFGLTHDTTSHQIEKTHGCTTTPLPPTPKQHFLTPTWAGGKTDRALEIQNWKMPIQNVNFLTTIFHPAPTNHLALLKLTPKLSIPLYYLTTVQLTLFFHIRLRCGDPKLENAIQNVNFLTTNFYPAPTNHLPLQN